MNKGLYTNRRAIRSLRVGVVPTSHVLQLAVGMRSLHSVLDQEIENIREKRKPIIINGEWGTGKSNLLSYVREYSLKKNIAVSYVSLNGRSTAVNHPQRFYHRIVSDLRCPAMEGKGINALIKTIVEDEKLKTAAAKWINSNLHKSELAQALSLYMYEDVEWALQVILGTDLYWADYKKMKALKRLDDLGGFLKGLGTGGFMVQLDELETLGQLWNIVSRQGAYRHLDYMISLNNLWIVFAATEKLTYLMANDLKSGRIKEDAAEFVRKYLKLAAISPPIVNVSLGRDLSQRIEGLYRSVYNVGTNTQIQSAVVEKWAQMALNNPRRLIRLVIEHLDLHRL